jgi:hypothetical protein
VSSQGRFPVAIDDGKAKLGVIVDGIADESKRTLSGRVRRIDRSLLSGYDHNEVFTVSKNTVTVALRFPHFNRHQRSTICNLARR